MNPDWDVLRDDQGEPVTLTPRQVQAVWHAINVVDQVRRSENYPTLWEQGNAYANLSKSRLLGRMLIDGRPPMDEKPPHYLGACGYHLREPKAIGHFYLGTVFMAHVVDGQAVVDEEAMWAGHDDGDADGQDLQV